MVPHNNQSVTGYFKCLLALAIKSGNTKVHWLIEIQIFSVSDLSRYDAKYVLTVYALPDKHT